MHFLRKCCVDAITLKLSAENDWKRWKAAKNCMAVKKLKNSAENRWRSRIFCWKELKRQRFCLKGVRRFKFVLKRWKSFFWNEQKILRFVLIRDERLKIVLKIGESAEFLLKRGKVVERCTENRWISRISAKKEISAKNNRKSWYLCWKVMKKLTILLKRDEEEVLGSWEELNKLNWYGWVQILWFGNNTAF